MTRMSTDSHRSELKADLCQSVASVSSVDLLHGPRRAFAIGSEEFLASISGVTDTPFQPGNRIDILTNGDEIYPPMLEAIEGA